MCFQNILLLASQAEALDGVLERVMTIARTGDASVNLVAIAGRRSRVPTLSAVQLARIVETFKKQGVSIASQVLGGSFVPEVISQVKRNGHDLAIVPTTAQMLAKGKPLGSDVLRLMRQCPCPVWVMRPPQPKRGGIMVAVNPGSPEDKDGVLSRSLLRLAFCASRLEDDRLSIVHIWHLVGEPQIKRPLVGARPEQITRLMDRAYGRAAAGIKEFLDTVELEGIKHELHLVKEHRPAKAIAEFATRNRVEVVVMGMMARSGLARLLVGNSAEEVFREVDCSIIILRSDRRFPPSA